jgi:hypothetical protein
LLHFHSYKKLHHHQELTHDVIILDFKIKNNNIQFFSTTVQSIPNFCHFVTRTTIASSIIIATIHHHDVVELNSSKKGSPLILEEGKKDLLIGFFEKRNIILEAAIIFLTFTNQLSPIDLMSYFQLPRIECTNLAI